MSAKKPNELIDRYEEMLRGTVSCYFDTDEIDEISDYYESKGQLSKALHAIEFGLNLHPDNVDLKLKEARYMLYLDRADEAKELCPNWPIIVLMPHLFGLSCYFSTVI